ncbi:Cue2 protein [Saccharomycopsis crataegensis]|uniref:Cue2 protein n=1 Tax=Saccharomycopsis crataegensis TaxID=43959 RepID=A0AAV5QH51_9ASCO|nr:Cue2 protein [Saccharomycopsis crataegensis]
MSSNNHLPPEYYNSVRSNDKPDEFNYLREMFLDVSDAQIEVALMECVNDVEKAVDYILSMNAIGDLDDMAVTTPEGTTADRDGSGDFMEVIHHNDFYRDKSSSTSNPEEVAGQKQRQDKQRFLYINKNLKFDQTKVSEHLMEMLMSQFGVGAAKGVTWSKLSHDSTKLAELTRIPVAQARSAIHASKGDFSKAIFFVICRKEQFEAIAADAHPDTVKTKRKAKIDMSEVRRVQPNSFSQLNINDDERYLDEEEEKYDEEEEEENIDGDYENIDAYLNDSYLASLQYILELSDEFYKLSYEFYIKGLRHFKGDVDAMVVLACVLISEKRTDMIWNLKDSDNWQTSTESMLKGKQRSVLHERKFQGSKVVDVRTERKVTRGPEYFSKIVVIDFHHFSVHEALNELISMLNDWWAAELVERERIGTVNPHMRRAVGVAPLHVITGRGNHSVRGYSRIKVKVRSYLMQEKYVFEEDVGMFFVYGKKCV